MYWLVFQFFIQKYYTWQNNTFWCGIISTKGHDVCGLRWTKYYITVAISASFQKSQQPTRIRDSSKTLIDNIFSNALIENTVSSNLTGTISDHLPQFIIFPNIFSNPTSNKPSIYERD